MAKREQKAPIIEEGGEQQGFPDAEAANPPEQKASFEEGMERLEQLVTALEAGKLPLNESFEAYEAGMKLLKRLEAQLAESEKRIALLTAGGEKPFVEEGE